MEKHKLLDYLCVVDYLGLTEFELTEFEFDRILNWYGKIL